MKPAEHMPSLEQALELVMSNTPRLNTIDIALDAAAGRVLAEDVTSDVDLPPFNKSAMDGYAVRAEDVAAVPAELRVVEEIPAGSTPRRALRAGQCAKIMTGAPVPADADTVVMVEHTEPAGEGRVRILRAVSRGANICLLGEDVRRGQVVVAEGTRLRPFDVALAAAAGRTALRVCRAPDVAIVATGDEVVEPDQVPRPGQIRNSNSSAIAARLRQSGIEADYLGIAPDEPAALRAALEDGLRRDVLIVSGGVSMGDYDLVPNVLQELGVELIFRQVAVKPGRPTVFGRRGDVLVFGLPGNPVSTLVIAELVLLPALRRMMGEKAPAPAMLEAVLDAPLSHRGNRRSFRPVVLRWSDGAWRAAPVEYHGSADLAGAARGTAFAAIPEDARELARGATAWVLLFPSSLL